MKDQLNIPIWNTKYEIGIPEVDFQHQYFLKLINRFHERLENGMDEKMINNHFQEIILYSRFHFCSEENLMLLNNYNEYESHKKLHHQILEDLSRKISMYETGKISLFEVVNFLLAWFLNHTVEEDSKIVKFNKQ